MVSFSSSTLLAFFLLYVPSVTIAQLKKAWEDDVPCKNFYDRGASGEFRQVGSSRDHNRRWRGGNNCWCPPYEGEDIEKHGNNFYWYYSGELWCDSFTTGSGLYNWIQAQGPFAQNWVNCDPTAPDVENVNLEWAVKHCDGISHETGVNSWGNSYGIKPNQKAAPLDLDVNYAMRCEYPNHVAVQCLCPEKNLPEGSAQICSKRVYVDKWLKRPWWKEWGSTTIPALNIVGS